MKPVFVLGVGAQKGGTSWLHKTLNDQDTVNMGFIKEYHVWDAKFSVLGKSVIAPLKKPDGAVIALRRLMQGSDGIYGTYFKGLIKGKVHITGDITPSYSSLDAKAFTHVRDVIERHGFSVKVVFLMRDPLERLWSALRMEKRNRESAGVAVTNDQLIQELLIAVNSARHLSRSNYAGTMSQIEAAFAPEEIHYALYENLFTSAEIGRLEEFLGIALSGIDFQARVNASPKIDLPKEVQEAVKQKLQGQYLECNKRFPETLDLWHKCP